MNTAVLAADDEADGREGFDFFIGRWWVRHRRLQRRLEADNRWDEFGGTCECRSIIGGLGNMDDNYIDLPAGGYRAATIRLFHPATRFWSIWWVDARNPVMEPPVRGSFENGVGAFFGDDNWNGRPIRVRFIWSEITTSSAQWQQAFSTDGGVTWEINWYMYFQRAG